MKETDVCIIGAGPAGASVSLMLSKLGIEHYVVDKASFPRDKTCGDGLILYVFKVLKLINPKLLDAFIKHPKFIHSWKGKLHISNKTAIEIHREETQEHAPIFYGKRIDFDQFLVDQLPSKYSTLDLGNGVIDCVETENGIIIKLKDGKQLHSKMVVGADGIQSIVSKKLAHNKIDKERTSIFVSAYFKGLENSPKENEAEIRLVYKNIPLFFYIFPLANGEVNVSLGGLSSEIQKHHISLKTEVEHLIKTHPKIAHKFYNAERLSLWRGWGIPCNFGHLKVSGNRFLLTGDAAGLANAFYKEGVGTAMMSGVIAAHKIKECIDTNKFDATMLSDYENQLQKEFGKLLKYSRGALKMAQKKHSFKNAISIFKGFIEKKVVGIIDKRTYS